MTLNSAANHNWQGRTLDADAVHSTTSVPFPVGFFLVESLVSYTGRTITIYTNSVLQLGDTNTITAANTSNTASAAHARWGDFSQAGAKGIAVEFLVYARTITDSERTTQIEPYFRNKYALW
jgi:hypothetical protein